MYQVLQGLAFMHKHGKSTPVVPVLNLGLWRFSAQTSAPPRLCTRVFICAHGCTHVRTSARKWRTYTLHGLML